MLTEQIAPTDRSDPSALGPRALQVIICLAWAYFWAVFVAGRGNLGTVTSLAILAAGFVGLPWLTRLVVARGGLRPSTALGAAVVMGAGLVAMTVADTVFAIYENRGRRQSNAQVASAVRVNDPQIWHGELFPRVYRPTPAPFLLYKPNTITGGESFGVLYHPSMLASRTLRDSVLERRKLSYVIGPLGVRESTPVANARIFALGDSFAMGSATDEGKVWTSVLGAALGTPVYNLGRSSTGPKDQLETLKYLLRVHADSMHPKHLLWMIFEGNDLENGYGDESEPGAAEQTSLVAGTLLEPLVSLPARVKQQSIIGRLLRGELRLGGQSSIARQPGTYEIDGVKLSLPLYHSARWGYRLFNPADVDRATKPESYVLQHPNRTLLDQTFREMKDLSVERGFDVTVVLAPSDARLYGAAFEGFPKLSDRPYFAEYVLAQAKALGFRTVNLLQLLEPFAAKEMLYYRDDHHWNIRGNEVTARLLDSALSPSLKQ